MQKLKDNITEQALLYMAFTDSFNKNQSNTRATFTDSFKKISPRPEQSMTHLCPTQ